MKTLANCALSALLFSTSLVAQDFASFPIKGKVYSVEVDTQGATGEVLATIIGIRVTYPRYSVISFFCSGNVSKDCGKFVGDKPALLNSCAEVLHAQAYSPINDVLENYWECRYGSGECVVARGTWPNAKELNKSTTCSD